MGLIIAGLGVIIFFGGNKLFEENIIENYYIIFRNQNVPEDFILEPVKSAGKGIGKELMRDVNYKQSPLRKYAIAGLGEIKYAKAADTLNTILHDLSEKPETRGEACIALSKIDTEKSASYVRIFIGSAHPIEDQIVIEYIKRKSRSHK